jgi:hypothetical protein
MVPGILWEMVSGNRLNMSGNVHPSLSPAAIEARFHPISRDQYPPRARVTIIQMPHTAKIMGPSGA